MRDHTFIGIGIAIAIGFAIMMIAEGVMHGLSVSDILLCTFALGALESLCILAHTAVNRR